MTTSDRGAKRIPLQPNPPARALSRNTSDEPDAFTPAPPTRRVVVQGKKFNVESVTYAGRDGRPLDRQIVRHPGSVFILPVLPVGTAPGVVLIRNWRPSVERRLWELPAGTRDVHNGTPEDPATCAERELHEETGLRLEPGGTLTLVDSFYTSPGLSDERMHAFVATGLRVDAAALEPDEYLSVHHLTLAQVDELRAAGEIVDLKTLYLLDLARRRGFLL